MSTRNRATAAAAVAAAAAFVIWLPSVGENGGSVAWQDRWDVVAGGVIRDISVGDNPLGQVGQLLFGPDGRVYIADPLMLGVFVLDSLGTARRFIGGAGSGPGEFRRLGRMGFRGDTLWMYDAASQRVELFSLEGKRVNGRAFQSSISVHGRLSFAALLANGSTIAIPVFYPGDSPPATPVLLLDSIHVPRVTLGYYSVGAAVLQFPRQNGGINMMNPLGRRGAWGVSSSGSVVAIGDISQPADSLDLTVFNSHGDTLSSQRIVVPLDFVRVVSARDTVATLLRHMGVGRAESRRLAQDRLPATEKDVQFSLLVATDSTIWVGWQAEDSVRWDVYQTDGQRLGSVLVPAAWQVRDVNGDAIWATSKDELDLPLLRRYVIRRR